MLMRVSRWSIVVFPALLAMAWVGGTNRLSRAPEPKEDLPLVRLVQPNVGQEEKWDPARQPEFLGNLAELSRSGSEIPDLILWPEAAVSMRFLERPENQALRRELGDGPPIAFGAIRRNSGVPYNSLAVLGKDGLIEPVYDKRHLVPFGEYMPFSRFLGNFLPLRSLAGHARPGSGPKLVSLDGFGVVLPLICYEALFPREVRQSGRPDILLNVTNDAWFGRYSGPQQLYNQTKMRAIELGIPLVRAANTGISAALDGYGRTIAQLPLNQQGTIDANIPKPLPMTAFAKYGDLPIGAMIFAVLTLLGISRVRAKTMAR